MGFRPSSEPRSNRGFTVLNQFTILVRKWFAETGTATPWLLSEEEVVPGWPVRSWGARLRRDTGGLQGLTKQQNREEAQPPVRATREQIPGCPPVGHLPGSGPCSSCSFPGPGTPAAPPQPEERERPPSGLHRLSTSSTPNPVPHFFHKPLR